MNWATGQPPPSGRQNAAPSVPWQRPFQQINLDREVISEFTRDAPLTGKCSKSGATEHAAALRPRRAAEAQGDIQRDARVVPETFTDRQYSYSGMN